jgi:hypothetical protein
MLRAIDASAGGDFSVGPGTRGLGGASLRAAAAAATATIRETDGSGRILAVLNAAIQGTDHWTPLQPVDFVGKINVVVTGASAVLILYEA